MGVVSLLLSSSVLFNNFIRSDSLVPSSSAGVVDRITLPLVLAGLVSGPFHCCYGDGGGDDGGDGIGWWLVLCHSHLHKSCCSEKIVMSSIWEPLLMVVNN